MHTLSETQYELARERMRRVMIGVGDGCDVMDRHAEKILGPAREMLSPDDLTQLTPEAFKTLLSKDFNRHWFNLSRTQTLILRDLEGLREGLAILFDESRDLAERFDAALARVHGMGKAVATVMLIYFDPERYGVWNAASEAGFKGAGIWPEGWSRDVSTGQRYAYLNTIMNRLSDDLDVSLWALDMLWLDADSRPSARHIALLGRPTPGGHSETLVPLGAAVLPGDHVAWIDGDAVVGVGTTGLCREDGDVPVSALPIDSIPLNCPEDVKEEAMQAKREGRFWFDICDSAWTLIEKRGLKRASWELNEALSQAVERGRFHGGAESQRHRTLKTFVAEHPEVLGLPATSTAYIEHGFLSPDRADVVFKIPKRGCWVAVEVELEGRRNTEIGAWQVVKFRTLLCVERGTTLDDERIQAVLVAHQIPTSTRELCDKYGVRWVEVGEERLGDT